MVLLALVLEACGATPMSPTPPLPPKSLQLNRPGELIDVAAQLPKGYVAVVDFWGEHCGACVVVGGMLAVQVALDDRILIRKVDVGDTSQEIEPGTLVYFPPGVPHRLNAHGGTLDYFEIQAWRSFKTTVLSKEAASGLKWYYERDGKDAPLVEWNQS